MGRDLDLPDRQPILDPPRAGRERALVNAIRRDIQVHDRPYRLRASETALLEHVGAFRVIDLKDLEDLLYRGAATVLAQDLRSLRTQGLVQRHTIAGTDPAVRRTVVTLTRAGLDVARQQSENPGQAQYAGFVKPREVPHDASLYRMFHAERDRIERAGGRVTRVVLDYELKRALHQRLNRPDVDPATRPAVAEALGLRIVDGSVQIPDLRLETETAQGDRAHVDLELATKHYKAGQLAAKAQAGFALYAPAGEAGRLSAALEERDLIVEILSL
jgi:hypothetical protein